MFNNGFNVHDHLKSLTVPELQLLAQKDRLGFSICILNLEHDLNVGNIIRSAHLTGVQNVFIVGKSGYDSRSTVGSHNYTNVVKLKADPEDVHQVYERLRQLEQMNFSVIAVDKTDKSQELTNDLVKCIVRNSSWNCFSPLLVFGNEQMGIPKEILEKYPVVHLRQLGVIRSYNVSSAASIVMYKFMEGYLSE